MGKGNAYHIDKLTILCAIFLYIKLKIKRLALLTNSRPEHHTIPSMQYEALPGEM